MFSNKVSSRAAFMLCEFPRKSFFSFEWKNLAKLIKNIILAEMRDTVL